MTTDMKCNGWYKAVIEPKDPPEFQGMMSISLRLKIRAGATACDCAVFCGQNLAQYGGTCDRIDKSRALSGRGEAQEHLLRRFDPGEIGREIVIAAALT